MESDDSILKDANSLLGMDGLRATSCEIIHHLWNANGQICRIKAEELSGSRTTPSWTVSSMIMKRFICPFKFSKWEELDEDIARRLISYQVDSCFYWNLAPALPEDIPVAEALASGGVDKGEFGGMAMLLSDIGERLDGELGEKEVHAAVERLARFHAFWWNHKAVVKAECREKLRLPPREEIKVRRERSDFIPWIACPAKPTRPQCISQVVAEAFGVSKSQDAKAVS